MPAWVAIVLLAVAIWLLAVGLIWKNSPIARREFPGGAGRLFVGQAVFCSTWILCPGLVNVVRQGLEAEGGLSRWAAIGASVAVVAPAWLIVRLAIPYTRRATSDWERWRSTPSIP